MNVAQKTISRCRSWLFPVSGFNRRQPWGCLGSRANQGGGNPTSLQKTKNPPNGEDMIKSIITNNCWAFMLYRGFGMRYESPTISLQIPAESYVKFCGDLKGYLNREMVECRELSAEHESEVKHLYKQIPEYPMGLIGDVLVVFQHDKTFEEAKEKWDRRKARVDYDNVAYLYTAFNETYSAEVGKFLDLKLPHSIVATEGFSYPGACRYDIPDGCDGFSHVNGKRVIEDNFSVAEWLEI